MNEIKPISERYQHEKETAALLRREGLTWHLTLPLSLHQTLFPSVFQMNRKE
ncbi:hypothetical protein GN156_10400 [bacterium LRH843]|nr:hypothetical protein [bacterium LRH843]